MLRYFFILVILSARVCFGQDVTGTVMGSVSDRLNGSALSNASITLEGIQAFTTTSDDNGRFQLSVPVGRYTIRISYTGFTTYKTDLLITAGKIVTLNATLAQSMTLLEVVDVHANQNEATAGARTLTIEKSLRFPANFFDPVRVITSYPGIITANDQSNSIIVRGNSPNGLLWRLNGLDIVNPNHLANAGTISDKPAANGGGVNILSAQMLGRTDFYTGFIPASYGNTTSGVIDMKLRDGNHSQHEFTAQASLIGIDLSAEGPVGQGKTSFLANYRYSTVGLLSAMGIDFGDEKIAFQDFSFATDTRISDRSDLSFFGMWGNSSNIFNAKEEADREEEKDRYDIDFRAQTYAVGFNFSRNGAKGKLGIGAAYSSGDQEREQSIDDAGGPFDGVQFDRNKRDNGLFSGRINYDLIIDSNTAVTVGVMTNVVQNTLDFQTRIRCQTCGEFSDRITKGDADGLLLQPFLSLSTTLSDKVSLSSGVRFVYYDFSSDKSIEPRVGLLYDLSAATSLNLSYSLVSQLQQPAVYLQVGNEDLGLTKSHHVDFDITHMFRERLKLTTNIYYQQMFDIPIKPGSSFSAVNYLEGSVPSNLINDGKAYNYGIESSLERSFSNSQYFLFGGSVYKSSFTTTGSQRYDTRFDGGFTVNGVYGKEWVKSPKGRTLGINTRVLYLGGLREPLIDVGLSEQSGETVYAMSQAYGEKLDDYFRVDFRISLRKDKPGYTRTLALDIQNLLNIENAAYHYYDMLKHQVVLKKQLGMIPILVYRIDF